MGLYSQVLCTYWTRTGRNHTSTEMDAFVGHVLANNMEYIFSLSIDVFLHPPSNFIFFIIAHLVLLFIGRYKKSKWLVE